MIHWLDELSVGLLLVLSAGYAIMSLGPRALRVRILSALSRVAAGAPRIMRLSRWAQRLRVASTTKTKGACAGCEDCGAVTSTTASSTPSEIKIPVDKIGRRA